MRKTLPITGYEVTFSHPKVGSLVIDAGAESLSWEYGLNTVVKPTLGGEVVQILSAYVGSISISGSTRTNDELLAITNWFKRYMLVAAGPDGNRDQTPVTFRLASRQWSFDMWVTSTPPLEYRTDLIAAPWSVTGEIAGDSSANDLAQATQSSLTDALTSKTFLHTVGWKGNLGANALRLIDPKNVSNASSDVDNIFENISRAVASLTTGVASFLSDFDATKDPDTQFDGKDSDDFYTAAFGTKYLTGGGSAGSAAAGTGEIGSDRASIIAGIKQVFEAKDIPAELGVLIALVETGGTLNPDARQPNGDYAVGLFQTFPTGAGGSRSFSSQLKQAFEDKSHPVTKHYTPVMQITAASEWIAAARNGSPEVTLSPKGSLKDKTDFTRIRAWAQAAQRAGVDYRTATKVVGYWNEAVRLVKEFGDGQPAKVADITLSGSRLSDAILNHKNFLGTDGAGPRGDIANYEAVGVHEVVIKAMLAILNAGWSLHISSVKTGRGGNNHGPGRAFDVNCYGPGAAFRNGGGTASADPTKFITFLKENRAALGGLRIGYGAGAPKCGSDFKDKEDHVHIDWTGSV